MCRCGGNSALHCHPRSPLVTNRHCRNRPTHLHHLNKEIPSICRLWRRNRPTRRPNLGTLRHRTSAKPPNPSHLRPATPKAPICKLLPTFPPCARYPAMREIHKASRKRRSQPGLSRPGPTGPYHRHVPLSRWAARTGPPPTLAHAAARAPNANKRANKQRGLRAQPARPRPRPRSHVRTRPSPAGARTRGAAGLARLPPSSVALSRAHSHARTHARTHTHARTQT